MVESILRNAGYRIGLFTSPHLCDVRERVRINGWVHCRSIRGPHVALNLLSNRLFISGRFSTLCLPHLLVPLKVVSNYAASSTTSYSI